MMTNPARGTDEPVYRMLGPNEIIQPGDEYRYPNGDSYHGDAWRKTQASIGSTPRTGPAPSRREYRRPVEVHFGDYAEFNKAAEFARKVRESSFAHNPPAAHSKFTSGQVNPGPGEGYRALTLGERVQSDDECWDGSTYQPVPVNVIGCAVPCVAAAFRRKIADAVQLTQDNEYLRHKLDKHEENLRTHAALIVVLKSQRDKYRAALRQICGHFDLDDCQEIAHKALR